LLKGGNHDFRAVVDSQDNISDTSLIRKKKKKKHNHG
jgi:hypothetical protein